MMILKNDPAILETRELNEAELEAVTGGELRQLADAIRQPNLTSDADLLANCRLTNEWAFNWYY